MPKLYITTFGCQMNQYDSDKMIKLMESSHGFEQCKKPEEADLLLINTCSVRHKAQEKLFSQLGQWKKFKEIKPNVIIAVGGCVASQEGDNILKRAQFVDIIFGPQTLHRLPDLYNKVKSTTKPAVDISFPEIEKFDSLPSPKADGPTAFVSIMEGCSKYCSFCIVPYTRGDEISRPFDDVLSEILRLAEQGVKEITLLGQNVNDYRGLMKNMHFADLALLISYIAAIDSIERIRFTTSHPVAFTDNLITAYSEIPKLANHLHLPVQSGSDRILSLMKRGYTILEYKNKIKKLRQARPTIKISTDIIVGFPSEDENDFQKTLDLVEEIGFDNSYSFIYSQRPGTPAATLPDPIPLATKKERLAKLQHTLRLHSERYSRQMVGSNQKILVTGPSKKNSDRELFGKTECNRIVNFEGTRNLIGKMVSIHITDALPNCLKGCLIS